MFTRDELDTILAGCDAADRLERILKTLGLDVSATQRAHVLLLKDKAAKLAKEIDDAEAAMTAKAKADVDAAARNGALRVAEAEFSTNEA